MSNKGKNGLSGGTIILIIIVILALFGRNFIPALAKFMLVIALLAIIGVLVLIGFIAYTAIKHNNSPGVPKQTKSELTPEQNDVLKVANQQIIDCRMMLNRMQNAEIRPLAGDAVTKAEKIVKVLKEQPNEIRRCHQFLNYYLPTLKVVIKHYRTLESGGIQKDATDAHMKEYLDDISRALTRQYDNLFNNEILDLTVEMEAMQNALKRDGLIEEASPEAKDETLS